MHSQSDAPLTKLLHAYYRLLQITMTVLMVVLIVPVAMQILSRFTGIIPRYIWTEEIARFCFVWIVMLGAMIAVRDGTHFEVDVLPKLGRRADALVRCFVHVAMLVLALVFLWYGYQFAKFGALQTSEIAGLPLLAIYVAWPLSGVTWILFILERGASDVKIILNPNAYADEDHQAVNP